LLEKELFDEIEVLGVDSLLNHLRLCGNIPESYEHRSIEEKLYSKYTDILLSIVYQKIGLKSLVITGRSDTADVEAFSKNFSFVADAKVFRLSKTAKNQKDFKVKAMDKWKHGKPFAMVVCPIYQLSKSQSQIYEQAISSDVCIFTYSHLAILVKYANEFGSIKTQKLLLDIFKSISTLNPTKSAVDYWQVINKTLLGESEKVKEFWKEEKTASIESIEIAKREGLSFLAMQKEKIMKMSHQEALNEIIKIRKIDKKIQEIQKTSDNGLFTII